MNPTLAHKLRDPYFILQAMGAGGGQLKGFLQRMSWLELCKADGKEILELQRLVRRSLKEIQAEQCEGLDIRC